MTLQLFQISVMGALHSPFINCDFTLFAFINWEIWDESHTAANICSVSDTCEWGLVFQNPRSCIWWSWTFPMTVEEQLITNGLCFAGPSITWLSNCKWDAPKLLTIAVQGINSFHHDGVTDRELWFTTAAAQHQERVPDHIVPVWKWSKAKFKVWIYHTCFCFCTVLQQKGPKLSLCKSESKSTFQMITEW